MDVWMDGSGRRSGRRVNFSRPCTGQIVASGQWEWPDRGRWPDRGQWPDPGQWPGRNAKPMQCRRCCRTRWLGKVWMQHHCCVKRAGEMLKTPGKRSTPEAAGPAP
eukprot:363858-Chlamydomonas_euryale.AAC.1